MTRQTRKSQKMESSRLVGLGMLIGLSINPTINAVKAEYDKNSLAMNELIPYIEMEDGNQGLSGEDIRRFSCEHKVNVPQFYFAALNGSDPTPGDLYFALRSLPRDSIESLIRSYRQ